MGEIYSQMFDLSGLLKSGDLDIRGIVTNNESLLVREFFNALSKFLNDAPTVADALTQISNLAGDEKDYQSIKDIKNLLTGIGYNKITPVIDGMLDANEKGNKEFAANCSKRISTDIGGLCERIKTAQKKSEAKNIHGGESTAEEGSGLLLKEALERLDYEETNRKLRILAVDDAAFMLMTIKTALSNDYEVFALTKATLVEKFLQHTTPELFLLDFNMPELSGFDLVPIIRRFEEHKDTPIIFLTAMGTPEHVTSAISLGACDYVVKPLNANILLEKIAKHIARKKAF